jgi:hypothetical protein
LGALAGPWAVVSPVFCNANPNGALSWAAFLSDYGRWTDGLPSGAIPEAPIYNAAYHRSVLLEFGDGLARALAHGNELPLGLRAHGHHAYLEASARLDHANVATPAHWLRERYISGLLIASHRARHWSVKRRLLYIVGSPLIPVVLLRRVLPGVRQTQRRGHLPAGTVPAIVLGMIVKAVGELAGYAGASPVRADRQMHEYEMHKVAYIGHRRR